MGQSNGSSPKEREITLHVPEGMDKTLAAMLFRQFLAELHEFEPLARPEAKEVFAQGLVNDMPKLSMFRKKIAEAPAGSRWGVSIVEPPSILMPGAEPDGFYIEAYAKMREAKQEGLEAVLKTTNCVALLTSATARGLVSMHGYQIKFTPPHIPEEGEGTSS